MIRHQNNVLLDIISLMVLLTVFPMVAHVDGVLTNDLLPEVNPDMGAIPRSHLYLLITFLSHSRKHDRM